MTTTIEFPTKNFFESSDIETYNSIPVMTRYPIDILLEKYLIEPDEKVLTDKEIKICFSYPLSDKFIFTFQSPDGKGFTRGQLAEFIINKYYQIYKEEEDTIQNKPILSIKDRLKRGGLINRNKTDGKYGIWGHDIGDLSLNCMIKDKHDIWHLEIDS